MRCLKQCKGGSSSLFFKTCLVLPGKLKGIIIYIFDNNSHYEGGGSSGIFVMSIFP